MNVTRRASSSDAGWTPVTFVLPVVAGFLLAVLLFFGASNDARDDGVSAQGGAEATETPKA